MAVHKELNSSLQADLNNKQQLTELKFVGLAASLSFNMLSVAFRLPCCLQVLLGVDMFTFSGAETKNL